MKNLRTLLITMVVIGITAGSAWAANGDLAAAAKTDIPAEAAATMQADETAAGADDGIAGTAVAANDAATGIQFTLGTPYVNNDTITFTLSAGKWQEGTYYLATIDDLDATDDDDTLTPTPLGKTPFAQISKTDTVITFRVTDDTAQIMGDDAGGGDGTLQSAVITGVTYYLVQQADPDTNAAGVLDLAATAAQTANPTISVASLATPGVVTCTVESLTSTGLALDTGGIKTVTLAQSYNQFTTALTTLANGIIDVTNNRTQFTVGDPLVGTDSVVVTITSDAAAEISTEQITTTGADSFVVTISGDMSSVAAVGYDVDENGSLADVNDVAAVIDTTVTPNTATLTLTGAQLNNAGGTIGDVAGLEAEAAQIVFIADGTVLATRTFTAQVAMNLADEAVAKDLVTAGTSIGAWTINGSQFYAPHMVSRGTYDSYLVLKSGTGSAAATVTIDLLNRAGETAQIIKTLEAASAGGSLFISASSLLADAATAGWTATGIDTDFSATFTVTLAETAVSAEGFKYNSASTDMNVMTVYEGITTRTLIK